LRTRAVDNDQREQDGETRESEGWKKGEKKNRELAVMERPFIPWSSAVGQKGQRRLSGEWGGRGGGGNREIQTLDL